MSDAGLRPLEDVERENRCGDPLCEDLRHRMAVQVLSGPFGRHYGAAVALDVERLARALGTLRWGWLAWTDREGTQPALDDRRERTFHGVAAAILAALEGDSK